MSRPASLLGRELEQASAACAAALATDPDNDVIAAQAMNHAVAAGDWPLALRAAHVLERHDALLPDARFLLVAEAFRDRDWRAARAEIDAVEREQLFAFAVPVLRAWLAFGSGQGDPLSFLPASERNGAAAAYAAEHRPLLLVATRRQEAAERFLETIGPDGPRSQRLRIAAASTLAARRDRDEALLLLQGDDAALVAARALVEARGRCRADRNAGAGVAELMVRLSLDMHAQDLTPVAASFARLATWLAPDNSQNWMIAAELLGQQDQNDAALALLSSIGDDDPYAAAARDQRIRLLIAAGEDALALQEAEAAASAGGATVADLVRYGEVLMEQDRPGDAARAYARAVEIHNDDSAYPLWSLWLFRGGAFDEADDWPQTKEALEQAYRLAPEQPLVLNYLGYPQPERREHIVEAERLVRERHRLAPDNAAITDRSAGPCSSRAS